MKVHLQLFNEETMQRSSISVTESQAKKIIKDSLESEFSTAGAITVNLNPGTEKNPNPHIYIALQRRDVTNYESMAKYLEAKHLQFERDFLNTNLGSPIVQGIIINSSLETVLDTLTAERKVNKDFLSNQALFQQPSNDNNAKPAPQKPVKKQNSETFNAIRANLKLSFGPQPVIPAKIKVESVIFESIQLPIQTREVALKASEQIRNGNRDLKASIVNEIMMGDMNLYNYLVAAIVCTCRC